MSSPKPLDGGEAHGTGDTTAEEESSYAWKKKRELSYCSWRQERLQTVLIGAGDGGTTATGTATTMTAGIASTARRTDGGISAVDQKKRKRRGEANDEDGG